MHATKDTAWDDGISRKFSDGRKITGCLKMRMFEILANNPDCQTRLLIEQIVEIEGPVPLKVRHVNRLRLEWGLGGKRGRPAKREPTGEDACRDKDLVEIRPRISHAGPHLFAIDREVNSEELARAFEDRKRGLICMLDANQYEDLSDWDAECIGSLEDGSKVWSGPWKEPGNDNRHFVIVEKEDRLLPFWATPCAKEMA